MKTISRKEFINKLQWLRPGLAQKDIIEQGVCFNFHGDHIVTYNDNISISVTFDSGVVGGVKAYDIYGLLQDFPEETDELEIWTEKISEENKTVNWLRLRAGRINVGRGMVNEPHPQLTNDKWVDLPEDLLTAISLTPFITSKDMTHPKFTCIHVQGDSITSSDGFRIMQVHLKEPSPFDFLLPRVAAIHLDKYNFSKFFADESWIHFRNDEMGLTFSSRLMAGEFHKVEHIFEDVEGESLALPKDLKAVLKRSQYMIESQTEVDKSVTMFFSDGKVLCRAEKHLGWIEEEMDLDYHGPDFKISINPIFLSKILDYSTSMIVKDWKCGFYGDNFRYVMSLIDEK